MTLHGAFDTLLIVLLISACIWIRYLLAENNRLSRQNRAVRDMIQDASRSYSELGKLFPRKGKR